MLSTLSKNNVIFYDEEKFDMFLYDAFYGSIETSIFNDDSGDAFFVCNVGNILDNIDTWRRLLPNVGIYYRVNANSDPILIKILKCYHIKFCITTSSELTSVLENDIPSYSIIYSSRCKFIQHIKVAAFHNIEYLTVNNIPELERIAIHHSNAKLLIQFTGGDNITNVEKIMSRCVDLNLTIVGLSFDFPVIDSIVSTTTTFDICFQQIDTIIDVARERFGFDIKMLNLGSNIPSFDIDQNSIFSHFVNHTNEFVQHHPNIEVIAEPCQFMTNSANKLYCNIVGVRNVCNVSTGEVNMSYYLNDGLYGSLSNILYREYHPELDILRKDSTPSTTNSKDSICNATFWGPTCDSMDKVCSFNEFPILSIGDTVIFKNVGPYTLSCATNFNGFNIPKSRYIVSYQRLESIGIDRISADLSRENLVDPVIA